MGAWGRGALASVLSLSVASALLLLSAPLLLRSGGLRSERRLGRIAPSRSGLQGRRALGYVFRSATHPRKMLQDSIRTCSSMLTAAAPQGRPITLPRKSPKTAFRGNDVTMGRQSRNWERDSRSVLNGMASQTCTERPEVWDNGTYVDNAFDLAMTAAFRVVMGTVAEWQSEKPFLPTKPGQSYEGLVEVAQALQSGKGVAAFESNVIEILDRFPRSPQLLQNNKLSMELLALLTPRLFAFLVGPSKVEPWSREDGATWESAVRIEKCRFLTETGCAGMCVGLCQRPTQRFFNEVAGLPMAMEPNFDDCSCVMTWGKAPLPRDEDPAGKQPCFQWCPTAAIPDSSASTPSSADGESISAPVGSQQQQQQQHEQQSDSACYRLSQRN
mmetsp:Transcript_17828/g.29551  ORF Transcript_17828/g.29551 Transcript_17828/m.29551 type:complete len:386 (-) Transcript_17828:145-1302(-)